MSIAIASAAVAGALCVCCVVVTLCICCVMRARSACSSESNPALATLARMFEGSSPTCPKCESAEKPKGVSGE